MKPMPRWVGVAGWLLPFSFVCAADDPWPQIAKYFSPPAQFAGELGSYRPILRFEDGREVTTPQQWPARRAEILRKWHEVMGAWPSLIDSPRIEYIEQAKRDNFIQHRVKVQIAADRMMDGYLLVPEQRGKMPAVLVPFYDAQTSIGQAPAGKGAYRDFADQLAKRGFVALAIGSPGGDARKPDLGSATCQPLSYLAYISANCANLLANLPQVDSSRIGIVGHSYGGKWAMFASCLYEKFAAAAWSDPGIVFNEARPSINYQEPWYLGLDRTLASQRKPGLVRDDSPRTGPYKLMIQRKMDLNELHALMAPRPFLVSGGSEDPPAHWTALNHSVAVNRLLGFENRVGMHNRPEHSPDAASNEVIYAFFEHFLKAPVK